MGVSWSQMAHAEKIEPLRDMLGPANSTSNVGQTEMSRMSLLPTDEAYEQEQTAFWICGDPLPILISFLIAKLRTSTLQLM